MTATTIFNRTLKKNLLTIFIFSTAAYLSPAYSTEATSANYDPMAEFNAYKKAQQQAYAIKNEFRDYRARLRHAFKVYQAKTAAVWGDNNVLPDKTNWVSYLNTINQRSIVDFEHGTVDVEIALPVDTSLSDQAIREKLKANIQNLFTQPADERSLPEMAAQPALVIETTEPPSRTGDQPVAVLQDQIADAEGRKVKTEDYEALSETLANQANTKIIRGNDGRTRLVYETQFRLVPQHIKIRAKKYQHSVNQNARQQQLPVELVFAVIETESMFNPVARSPAPAFGLMQLVPGSGARDAYQYLYNEDRIVTDTYLYNPDNNIKLGSAYLHRLYYDYFAEIKSDKARLWATIAAYNTGPGNVFRAFAGRYSRARFANRNNWKKAALREINRRSAEQVYQYMRGGLPYAETRAYVQKVRQRMAKYVVS